MKTGYDQFFKNAKNNSAKSDARRPVNVNRTAVQNTKTKQSKKTKKFPVFQFILFALCGFGLLSAFEDFDQIESYMKKVEITLGTAHAEEVAQPATATKSTTPVAEPAVAAPAAKVDDADYLFKLADRKKELDSREEELNKKANEIAKQKEEIDLKLKELEQYRSKISSILQERIASDSGKIDTLVQVYTNMKPQQAAKIFETMDEDLVIEILGRMKKKSAADIMNLVKAEKAQIFAERYAGYRMPASKKTETTEPTAP